MENNASRECFEATMALFGVKPKYPVQNLEVVFDNGGGITVQCDRFAHWYNDGGATQAADDVKALLAGESPDKWDGNDDAVRIDYTGAQISNGSVKVMSADDLRTEIADGVSPIETSWHNIGDFLVALTGRALAE